ncbi:MAG TPA: YncE family protein [Candidatus Acidoferrales bacterium]|nr:YncE family protein [Candidatus Acidoferrales bacterium]
MTTLLQGRLGSIVVAGAVLAGAALGGIAARPAKGAAALPGGSGYHLKKKIKVGGEGGWDYLMIDSATRRLFISRGTHVMVVDVDSDKVVADIPDTPGVHGIALAPKLNRGFVSNGRGNNVTIFDLKTLATLGHAPAGQNPDAIIYDPASERAFAMNGRSGDVTAIDGATGNVAGTIAVGGKLEFAAADGKGRIYVNVEDKSEIAEIDSKKLSVIARWPMAPCEEPSGLAMDTKHRRLFAGCSNQMMAVIDADSGKVLATPPIGAGVDADAFDPGTEFAFASCGGGDGELTVVHEDSKEKFSVVENVPTQRGARTMALDPKSHEVYLVTAEFGPRPEPTKDNPRPRPPMLPDSFVVLVFAR